MQHVAAQPAKKPSKLKIVVIALVIIFLVAGIGSCMSPTVQIPDTVGKSGSKAKALLNDAGFNTIQFKSESGNGSSENDMMQITSQEPAANSNVQTNTSVELVGKTYTDYFKSLELKPLTEVAPEIEKSGYTVSGVYSLTGASLNSDLNEIAKTSTGSTWCAVNINVNTQGKSISMTVDSIEHATAQS